MAGLTEDASAINNRVGGGLRTINASAEGLIAFVNDFLDRIPAGPNGEDGLTLAPYSFSATDAAAMRAAIADTALLYAVYTGQVQIVLNGTPQTHDFRISFAKLWGDGS